MKAAVAQREVKSLVETKKTQAKHKTKATPYSKTYKLNNYDFTREARLNTSLRPGVSKQVKLMMPITNDDAITRAKEVV